MNPLLIVSKVEVYNRPEIFDVQPEWYQLKKLDHELPEDIKIQFDDFIAKCKEIETNGITHEGKTYYKRGYEFSCVSNNKMVSVESKDIPDEIKKTFWDLNFGPFSKGIRSIVTKHLYLYEHGSKTKLCFFPDQSSELNALYDKTWPHVQNIIDNYVGKPIRLKDLPLCLNSTISDFPDFSKHDFTIYSGESSGSVITRLITYAKLHLTDLQGHKIVKMCNCCNAYEVEENGDC